jgi:hypothetical protein
MPGVDRRGEALHCYGPGTWIFSFPARVIMARISFSSVLLADLSRMNAFLGHDLSS